MGEKKEKIRCEGFHEDNRLHMVFRDELNKADWQMQYCYSFRYTQCPVYCMLLRAYEESHRGDSPEREKSATIGTCAAAETIPAAGKK